MARLESLGKVIETDVLVIGGGIAGLWAAKRAKELVDTVYIVDKGPRDWGGLGSMSGGAIIGVLPGEDVNAAVEELVYYYDGLCPQDLITEILRRSAGRIHDYERFGYNFFRQTDGSLKGIPQRGLKHIKCYVGKPFGLGGKNLIACLVNEVERLGVKRLGRILVTDLIKDNGKIAGALGFHTGSGEFFIFKARSVILTTGHGSWKTSYHYNTATGESIEMALRAGVELSNFEFLRVWNVPRLFAWEGQTHLLPLGAKYINAKGEAFMDKYSPIFGANTDPHYIVRAMAIEARDGKGPFYFDCSSMTNENKELMTPKGGWMELNYHKLLGIGLDFFQEKLEWISQLRMAVGGIKADIKGATAVPGLFVAGRARSTDPAVYMGGWSLCLTGVTGEIAGEEAAKYVGLNSSTNIDSDEIKIIKKSLFAPLKRSGISEKEVLSEIQSIIFPYDISILKNENSLKKAIARLKILRDELLPRMAAKDEHHLLKLIEVKGIALVSELYIRASLMRAESRGGHYREDCPDHDDKNWLKWIVFCQNNGDLCMRTESVPVQEYKFKPNRYYMDDFAFPRS